MKKKRFSVEQITSVVQQVRSPSLGGAVADSINAAVDAGLAVLFSWAGDGVMADSDLLAVIDALATAPPLCTALCPCDTLIVHRCCRHPRMAQVRSDTGTL